MLAATSQGTWCTRQQLRFRWSQLTTLVGELEEGRTCNPGVHYLIQGRQLLLNYFVLQLCDLLCLSQLEPSHDSINVCFDFCWIERHVEASSSSSTPR